MQKILYIISDWQFGGGSRHVFDLITSLDKKQFTPILISVPSPILDLLKNKIKTYSVPMNSRLDLKAVKEMQNIIAHEKPDIIHLHSTRAGILGTIAAKKFKIPIIYTEHLFTKEYIPHNKLIHISQLIAFKHLAKNIDKVIVVSEAVKEYLADKKIFPEDKMIVIYHGVEIKHKYTNSTNRTKKAETSKILIGSMGALYKDKGYEYLLKVIPKITQNNLVKLEILGAGPLENKLKQLSENLEVTNVVKFCGFQKNTQKFMVDWDIYVQPSLDESFCLALAEAMAMGLPVIASKTGGMPELVGEAGLLVPTRDENALENAIIKLANDAKLRIKLGKKAKERINKYFTIKNMIQKTEELYRSLL